MISINEQSVSRDETWHACGGEVRGLVRRLRRRRRAHQVRQFAAMLFVALAPVSLFYSSYVRSYLTSQIELQVASVPCGYYEDEMRDYYSDHSRSDLPSELWVHLSHCPDCSRDLVFYGGIARCVRGGRVGGGKPSAQIQQPGVERAVTLSQVLAQGTLAIAAPSQSR
jgi:hypothetical protein